MELESLEITVVPVEGSAHVAVRQEILTDADGPYIRLTTQDAVREPVLKVRVQARWAGGTMSREYALLINPR